MPEAFDVDASPIDEEIVRLERAGWVALSDGTGSDFYRRMLTEDAVIVLPIGTLGRDATIEAFAEAPPWIEHVLDDISTVVLSADAALVTYRATASRAGDAHPYVALMTSVYRRVGDGWQLVLHQQTPTT